MNPEEVAIIQRRNAARSRPLMVAARQAGLEVKARMQAGEMSLAEALDHPGIQGFLLVKVMKWQRGVKDRSANRLLDEAWIQRSWLTRPLRDLTARQKLVLGEAALAKERRSTRNGT